MDVWQQWLNQLNSLNEMSFNLTPRYLARDKKKLKNDDFTKC